MKACKPVSVPKSGFVFCKYSVAVILWLSFILKLKWLVIISFAILALSAILKIKRAPLIWVYSMTINKIIESKNEILDENAMKFAHTLGSLLTLICIILLYFVNEPSGWIMVLIVSIAKTAGALGFCSALKLYGCLSNGQCCRNVGNRKC